VMSFRIHVLSVYKAELALRIFHIDPDCVISYLSTYVYNTITYL
jgi:hypothetical protein